MKRKENIIHSSGNVFRDLECKNPEESFLKSQIAFQLSLYLKEKKLTQMQLAQILNIDQPKISKILKGRLRSFSLERLLGFINKLGYEFEIKFYKK